jgi:hypothetical protein
VCAAVYKDFFDAGVGEELERIFNERGIGEGQQTLRTVSMQRMGDSLGYAYSRVLACEGTEACLERIREYLGM